MFHIWCFFLSLWDFLGVHSAMPRSQSVRLTWALGQARGKNRRFRFSALGRMKKRLGTGRCTRWRNCAAVGVGVGDGAGGCPCLCGEGEYRADSPPSFRGVVMCKLQNFLAGAGRHGRFHLEGAHRGGRVIPQPGLGGVCRERCRRHVGRAGQGRQGRDSGGRLTASSIPRGA
jgi:hypothetical protein